MSEDTVEPVSLIVDPLPTARGRPADLWAALIAATGTMFGVIGAIWFFAGFAENDTRPEHLISALALTLALFGLAIAPFAIVAEFARQAYRRGGRPAHYFWTALLMLPWVGLAGLSLTYTPLPRWVGLSFLLLSGLLCLWAGISAWLDYRNKADDET